MIAVLCWLAFVFSYTPVLRPLKSDAPSANGYADTLYGFDFDLNIPCAGSGLGVRTFAMRRSDVNDYSHMQAGSYAVDDPALFGWVTQKGV